MNKISKKIIAVIAVLLGAVALVGCSAGNSQKVSYNTSGLTEKKAGKVKFYTSKADAWKEGVTETSTTLSILDIPSATNVSIQVSSDETKMKTWDKLSQDSIKKELESIGAKNVDVKDADLSGKKAYKTAYDLKESHGDRYYVNLDGKHVAIVTCVKKQGANDSYQKEIENIVNTIEYVN